MNGSQQDAATSLHVIENLRGRLRALQHHLKLAESNESADLPSAYERIQTLNAQIDELASKNRTVSDLLYFYAEHRHVFESSILPSSSFGSPSTAEELAVVKSCATSFPATISQLDTVQSLAIPPSEDLAALEELRPRLARVELKQSEIGHEMTELRARTAALLQRWHSVSVLAAGECWAEWEERLLRIERAVRNKEFRVEEEKEGQ